MKDFFGHKIKKTDITNLAISLYTRLFSIVEQDIEMKTLDELDLNEAMNFTLTEELDLLLNKEKKY